MGRLGREAPLRTQIAETDEMKFLRQFVVACALVAVIVGLGFAWKHSPAAGLVADGGRDRRDRVATAPIAPDDPAFARIRERDNRGEHGMSISNLDDLAQSLVAEAAIVGVVVVIDLRRRKARTRPA